MADSAETRVPPAVLAVLAEAQDRGFLGPGPLEPHVSHSLRFAEALSALGRTPSPAADHVVDLGAGAGVPGLVLASIWPDVRLTLVEGSSRRAAFLEQALKRCGLDGHAEVVAERAEVAGRSPSLRGRCTVVVARAFGGPSETAECGSPFLSVGGLLLVSEPPHSLDRGSRWPGAGIALLGLELVKEVGGDPGYAAIRRVRPCPDRFPRRTGIPRKRPLF